jgi:(5-formylfuran-3-yl)methyl phosphate synthase
MTWMLATVTGPEEAEIAVAAGVDIVDFAPPDVPLGLPDPEALRAVVDTVAGRCRVSAGVGILPADPGKAIAAVRAVADTGVDSVLVPVPALDQPLLALLALPRDARLIAVLLVDRHANLAWIGPLAHAGFAGAMLDTADKTGGRLLDHVDAARLFRFVSLCRGKGLEGGFAGGLEAPDVPRLLALKPDVLGFRGALCHGADRRAGLDRDAVVAIRRLIPPHAEAEAEAGRADGDVAAQHDRVFVRDFVLHTSIGAYRHERERPQRVRFDVVADVPPPSGGGDDIGNVFSYDVILDTIRALAENRHVNLVETLAEEIAARLLEHGRVAAVTVRVEKLDVAPAVVGVEIARRAR